MKLKNLLSALKFQLPLRRFFRNFVITRNAWGLFHKNSHINQSTGKLKVSYPTLISALKAQDSMQRKHGRPFSVYKCIYCDGFHIGGNRNSR